MTTENVLNNSKAATRPWWKKKRWWVVAVCFFLFGIFAYGKATYEPEFAKNPLECDFTGLSDPEITQIMPDMNSRKQKFTIPQRYLLSIGRKDGEIVESVLMNVWRDSFQPLPIRDLDIHRDAGVKTIGKGMNIIVQPTFEGALERHLKNLILISEIRGTELSDLRDSLDENGPISDGFVSTSIRSDIFLSRNNNNVADLLVCNHVASVPYPGCQHHFSHNGFNVNIGYPRSEMDRWLYHRQRTVLFLDCLMN